LLQRLRQKAEGELARLDALIRAARDEPALTKIRAELENAGLTVRQVRELRETGGNQLFAWLLDAQRP
jgi:hypothetical protein